MEEISYKVPLLKQNIQDCVQACAAQILAYYGINKSIEEIKQEVPVYIDSNNRLLGSSLGHMAAYFGQLGLKVTIHVCDIEIFDPSWQGLSNQEIMLKLRERRNYLKHARYDKNALDLVIDGYIQLLSSDARIVFPIVDETYLYELLQKGPIYAVVSFNFLNRVAKYRIEADGKPVKDSIEGSPSSHAAVISGYKEGKFEITDPDYEFGGKRLIESNLLIAAFYLAETEFDSVLISLNR
jgi:hypothetical protein